MIEPVCDDESVADRASQNRCNFARFAKRQQLNRAVERLPQLSSETRQRQRVTGCWTIEQEIDVGPWMSFAAGNRSEQDEEINA